MFISNELQALLNCKEDRYSVPNNGYESAVEAVVASIKQGYIRISMDALKHHGEHVKGSFVDDGIEIWEIGDPVSVGQGFKPYWISVGSDIYTLGFPSTSPVLSAYVLHMGLNEKDENGDWITFC